METSPKALDHPTAPIVAAAFGAIALAHALPPYNHESLAFIAFAPLLAVASRLRPLLAVGLGLLSGALSGAFYVGWHHDTMRLFWAYLPFLWVAVMLAILCCLSSLMTKDRPTRWIVVLATTAVSLEFATVLMPLPVNIAIAVYKIDVLRSLASIVGIWGISLIVWLCNVLAASVLVERKFRPEHYWALGAITLALLSGFGQVVDSRDVVRLVAIQDFTGDETPTLAPEPPAPVDRDVMTRSVRQNLAPTVIVWSEECLGSGFHTDNIHDATVKLVKQIKLPLVVGYNDDNKPKPHNCAAWLSPDGRVLGVHHKEHLYLGESQTIQPGKGGEAFDTPLGRVGLEVCFDSNYTALTREEVLKGAQVILIPNYDPPTPRGTLHYLHAALLTYRAAENHVPIVRCDSNGLSQVIDPHGNVVAQGPLYAPASVEGFVLLGDGKPTFFTRWGDWLAFLCVLTTASAFVMWCFARVRMRSLFKHPIE